MTNNCLKYLGGIIMVTTFWACSKPSGTNDNIIQGGSGNVKLFQTYAKNGGIEFEYDNQSRVKLIRTENYYGEDSFFVFYTNNVPTRLLLYTYSPYKFKTPIILNRDLANNVTKIIYKKSVKERDDNGNLVPLFNNENDPYYATYNVATDSPSVFQGMVQYEYNAKNFFTKYKRNSTTYEFTYATGDTIPVNIKRYHSEFNGSITIDASTNLDSVLTKNVNPIYTIMKDVPIIDVYGQRFLPLNTFNEDGCSDFLFYSKYLPNVISFNTATGFPATVHFKYEFDTLGRVVGISHSEPGYYVIYPVWYY